MNVRPGDHVKVGQLLARLSERELNDVLTTAQANLASAQSAYDAAAAKNARSSDQIIIAKVQVGKATIALQKAQGAGKCSPRLGVGERRRLAARGGHRLVYQPPHQCAGPRADAAHEAHELHTPLTALRSNLDLAVEESNAVEQRAYLERAQATVQRLELLTNDLLDLSRIQATKEQTGDAVDLSQLLRERSKVYASQAEQAGIVLQMHFPDAEAQIRAQASQVLRALDNLVDNACKFTPAGGTVTLSLGRQDGQVLFSVEDTGIGIPADYLAQLFQRFHRGRNATGYPGSGLGLAIVKAIMEQQGGRVLAQNTAAGARFSLTWPELDK